MQPLCMATASALIIVLLAVAASAGKQNKRFEVVGCHRFHGGKHNGSKTRLGGIAANPAECGQLCSGLGYRYFALKAEVNATRSLCWCVRRRHRVKKSGSKHPKPRDQRFRCKKQSAFLFRLIASHSNSLGCHSFNVTLDRLRSAQRSLRMSPALCSRHCHRYAYFGLARGSLCWCIGARLFETYGGQRHAAGSETCSQVCPGDRRHFCGSGKDRQLTSVYRVHHY